MTDQPIQMDGASVDEPRKDGAEAVEGISRAKCFARREVCFDVA